VRNFIIIFTFSIINIFAQNPIINTDKGAIEGSILDSVYQFLGVPYAAAPVGELRWKPTQEHSQWSEILPTKKYPNCCPQKVFEQAGSDSLPKLIGNEDCLFLNIWTPNLNAELPVMVFIHGGGNQQGSTDQMSVGAEIYNGKNLSKRGNVVVVTIQYRLGVLGFLVHPGLERESPKSIAGNYAVMDQIFALKWIKKNISKFGGDTNNVTIFGESAGGLNIINLMISPLAKGLFHKAIIQSGVPAIGDYNESKIYGVNFVNQYIPYGNDSVKISFMRNIHPDSLTIKLESILGGGIVKMNWQPVLDGYIFKNFPFDAFKSGDFNHMPMIIGTNSEEMSEAAGIYPDSLYPKLLDTFMQRTIPAKYHNEFKMLYPDYPNEKAKSSYISVLTDGQFTSMARRVAQCVSVNQNEPVWRYLYSHKHTFPGGEKLGSYHGMELFYIFNNWENTILGIGILFKEEDEKVQKYMLGYWVNFAKTGNPNGDGLITWNRYNSNDDSYLDINASPKSGINLKKEECDFFDKVVNFEKCTSTSVEEIIKDNKILYIFPNIASDYIEIHISNVILSKAKNLIKIYNPLGECVMTVRENGHSPLQRIDISYLPVGFYFVQIGNYTEKFMVVR